MITAILLSVIVIIFTLDYLFHNNSFAKKILKLPGPPLKFFFGNSLEIFIPPVDQFRKTRERAAQFNGIYRFYAYNTGAVEIYNPQDVEIIVSNIKYHEKSDIYHLIKPWLNEGLLLSNGPKWQKRRKIITSAFHFNVLQKYHPTIEDNSAQLVKVLEKTNGEAVDIISVLSEYTLHAICETAMGTPLREAAPGEGKLYKDSIYALGKSTLDRLVNFLLHPDFIFNLTPVGRRQAKDVEIVHNFTSKMIMKRKQNLENNQNQDDNTEADFYGKKKREAMLDLLITAQKNGLIDDAGIQEEVDTFTFAGHDTTAAGLTYCLMSLANEPDVQARAIEEMDNLFGDDTRPASLEDIANMRYLERCIKESLRLYPPVPFISRRIKEDTVLSGYTIPAGAQCHIHIFDLHRQENLYKDPLKFDPDRFLPENSIGRHNYAYIPFSAGPRNCIGQKFAMMEMKLAVSSILRNFKLLPVTKASELRFVTDIVLRSYDPVYVKFVKRN